jgi:hypothetical protein
VLVLNAVDRGFEPRSHIKIVSEKIRLLSDVDLNLEQNLPEVERRSRTLKIYKQQNRLNVKCKDGASESLHLTLFIEC